MPLSLIEGNPTFKKDVPQGEPFINVSEFFCDVIQGEGINMGVPAAFLRVQHCTMACIWCDTSSVWMRGNPYTYDELFTLMDKADLPNKLKNGTHWVFTGGSPVLAQHSLIPFIQKFIECYGFKPYIEIENECTLMPDQKLIDLVDCWNNSPKLKGSGNADFIRYQPHIIHALHLLPNAWFKFVVSQESDWEQIQDHFINEELIRKDQIILMPLGGDRKELFENREAVVEMAIKHNVRYSTREHIVLYDKKTGI